MVGEQEKSVTRQLAEAAIEKRRTFNKSFPWDLMVDLIVALVDHQPPIGKPTLKKAEQVFKEIGIQAPNGVSVEQICKSALPWIDKVKSG